LVKVTVVIESPPLRAVWLATFRLTLAQLGERGEVAEGGGGR
jgi:hypothetical protein